MLDDAFVQEMKKRLETERDELEAELTKFAVKDKIVKGDYDTVMPDYGNKLEDDNVNEIIDFERQVPVEHSLELKLLDVNRALEKIGDGSYGACEADGGEIARERLEALPSARHCIDHEVQSEQK
jgi:RNA polymerase-binding transcription factor DksA